jgi:hypothetical protein
VCVVAHNGIAGHQGLENTMATLAAHYWWPTLKEDAKKFARECLHCLSTRGGIVKPRPWGEQVHATKPNEVLHFDFLYLGLAATGKSTCCWSKTTPPSMCGCGQRPWPIRKPSSKLCWSGSRRLESRMSGYQTRAAISRTMLRRVCSMRSAPIIIS